MNHLPTVLLHFIWVIPLILLIVYVGSHRFRGTSGQTRARRMLSANLQKNQYTVVSDLTIPAGGGTVRIDHLVISQFGIFVLESVNRRGKISGTEFQDRWKEYRYGRFKRFDNPLHQNYLAIEALGQLLHLPHSAFHSIVLVGDSGSLVDKMPANVIPMQRLIPFIRKKSKKLLPPEEANLVLREVEAARLSSSRRGLFDRWSLLRLLLVIALLVGSWFAFGGELKMLNEQLQAQMERKSAPEMFHADGRRKSEQELWETSLRCIYSADSGNCSCYEPSGSKINLKPEKCKELSERDSILKR
jgi:restriction system protein